jgi:hypothetical protein
VPNFSASSGASGLGFTLEWSLDFDDAANTITINATHVRNSDGAPAPAPQQAELTFRLSNNQSIGVNLITGRLTNGQLFDGTNATMINSGPRTRSGVTLSVSADRASLITNSTSYVPPGA